MFTVVNGYGDERTYDFELVAEDRSVKFYDSITGEITVVDVEFKDDKVTFGFTLPANRTGFFVIEK